MAESGAIPPHEEGFRGFINRMAWAEVLAERRTRLGLTPAQIAERGDIPEAVVLAVERGERLSLRLEEVAGFERGFGVPWAALQEAAKRRADELTGRGGPGI